MSSRPSMAWRRREVSPRESSSQRLWTVFVPGLMPHEAKDSAGRRGRSHSESDSGEEKASADLAVVDGGLVDGARVAGDAFVPLIFLAGLGRREEGAEFGQGEKFLKRNTREMATANRGFVSVDGRG